MSRFGIELEKVPKAKTGPKITSHASEVIARGVSKIHTDVNLRQGVQATGIGKDERSRRRALRLPPRRFCFAHRSGAQYHPCPFGNTLIVASRSRIDLLEHGPPKAHGKNLIEGFAFPATWRRHGPGFPVLKPRRATKFCITKYICGRGAAVDLTVRAGVVFTAVIQRGNEPREHPKTNEASQRSANRAKEPEALRHAWRWLTPSPSANREGILKLRDSGGEAEVAK
jgi:hypothetical protein